MSYIQETHQPQAQNLQLKFKQSQQKYESLKLVFNQTKEQLKKAEEANPNLLIDLSELQKMIEQLQRQTNEGQVPNSQNTFEIDNAGLERQIGRFQTQLANNRQKLNKIEQENRCISDQSQNPEFEAAKKEKQQLIHMINQAREQCFKNIDSFKKQAAQAQQLRKQNENISVKIRDAQQQQIQVNNLIKNWNQQIFSLQNKLAELEEQIFKAKEVSRASYSNQSRLQAKEAEYQDFEKNKRKLIEDIKQRKQEEELEKGKTVVLYNKGNSSEQKLKQVEGSIVILQKHFQQIRDKMKEQTKKAQEIKQGKQKGMKKQKPKNELKSIIVSLQTENAQLEVDINRQDRKLEELIKVQKSYQDPQRLHELKAEYNQKQQIKMKQEFEQKKNKKLIDDNKVLKERIQMLKDMAQKHFRERQIVFNQINQKIANKRQTKADIERQIEENNKRIQIYSTQFPNYQKQKQQRKQNAKRQKNEIQKETKQKKPKKKAKQQQKLHDIEYLIQKPASESFITKVFSKILPS